jgi:hypothetical protein
MRHGKDLRKAETKPTPNPSLRTASFLENAWRPDGTLETEAKHCSLENIPHNLPGRHGPALARSVVALGLFNIPFELRSPIFHRAIAQNLQQRFLFFQTQSLCGVHSIAKF